MAFDRDTIANVRAAGSILDSVRHDPLHDPGPGESLASFACAGGGTRSEMVDGRNGISVFLSDLWRLFWSRQRDSDAGGDGPAGLARYSSGKRHQEFPGHLHQQCRGRDLFFFASGVMAAVAADGSRGLGGRLFWRPHRAARRSRVHQAGNRGDWICDYDRYAVANELAGNAGVSPAVARAARYNHGQ